MMGATHGLAGIAAGAMVAGALHATGVVVDVGDVAAIVAAAAVASELPDLDLAGSRISHGSSSLTAIPVLGRLALLATLPIALAGIAIRRRKPPHRGPTHSPAAAVLWALAIVPLFAAYIWATTSLAHLVLEHWPSHNTAHEARHFAHQIHHLQHVAEHHLLAIAPWIALATLAGYLTHLPLDSMTKETQQLAWPFSDRGYTLKRPTIPVGGWKELLLIRTPLFIVLVVIAVAITEPQIRQPSIAGGNQFMHCISRPADCHLTPPSASSATSERAEGRPTR